MSSSLSPSSSPSSSTSSSPVANRTRDKEARKRPYYYDYYCSKKKLPQRRGVVDELNTDESSVGSNIKEKKDTLAAITATLEECSRRLSEFPSDPVGMVVDRVDGLINVSNPVDHQVAFSRLSQLQDVIQLYRLGEMAKKDRVLRQTFLKIAHGLEDILSDDEEEVEDDEEDEEEEDDADADAAIIAEKKQIKERKRKRDELYLTQDGPLKGFHHCITSDKDSNDDDDDNDSWATWSISLSSAIGLSSSESEEEEEHDDDEEALEVEEEVQSQEQEQEQEREEEQDPNEILILPRRSLDYIARKRMEIKQEKANEAEEDEEEEEVIVEMLREAQGHLRHALWVRGLPVDGVVEKLLSLPTTTGTGEISMKEVEERLNEIEKRLVEYEREEDERERLKLALIHKIEILKQLAWSKDNTAKELMKQAKDLLHRLSLLSTNVSNKVTKGKSTVHSSTTSSSSSSSNVVSSLSVDAISNHTIESMIQQISSHLNVLTRFTTSTQRLKQQELESISEIERETHQSGSTEFVFDSKEFSKFIMEVMQDYKTDLRLKRSALDVLQTISESYLIELFEDAKVVLYQKICI